MVASSTSVADATSIAPKHLVLLVLMNLVWGANLIASKIGVAQLPPILFTALRFGSLALFLLPLLKIHRGQMGNLFLAALLTGPAAFSLLFLGVYHAEDAATVAIASQMGVPMSTLLSIWLLGETIRWRRTLGITLAFGGMVIISFDPRVFAYWEGMALVVASTFFASLGTIFVKRLHNIRALELQAWIAMAGGSVLMLLSLMFESGQWEAIQAADWKAWTALAFTTLMSSLLAHTAWYYLISKYPVTSLSPITLLSPLFGIFFGVTLLNDQLTTRMLLGGAVTLIGVFIVVIREKKLVDTGT
ncbi:MAG TPA: DMT family transporter [Steroidobacter sp.]|uniref:DMT family transporter n=1 Tax=Steroidobacter sp. TaxID=1978227 RepID=UPI002EDA9000